MLLTSKQGNFKRIFYQPYIDGLRGITATYVIFHHIMLSFRFQTVSYIQNISIEAFSWGHYAVDIFIVLSGYCLALPVLNTNYTLKKGMLDFFKRRFLRIYPTYILSLFFSTVLISTLLKDKTGTLFDLSIPFNSKDFITHILLIPDLFYDTIYKINYVYWSVAVESRIYVLFPIILFFCKKWGIEITLLLAFITSFVIWSVMFLLFHIFHNLDIGASGVHPYIILFVTGMLAANLSFNSAYFTNGSWKKWLPLIFFTLTIILLNRLSRGNTTQDILVGVITMWLLIGINNPKNNFLLGYLNKAFSWHPFVWLGSFAYSIYLFHPLFIQLLWMYIINPLKLDNFTSYFLFILLGTPIILLLCYLSFLLFENPFLKYRKKKGLFENNLKVASEPVP